MPKQKPKFDPKNQHSQKKLDIFSRYLQLYLSILGEKCPSIRVYDMFAGKGKYGEHHGSAVRAVDIIKEYRTRSEHDVRLYLNEKKTKNYNSLCQNINLQTNKQWLTCTQKDANDIIPKYLSDCRDSYQLFFLDPFGYTQISKETVDNICKHRHSECLWFIPVSNIRRFAFTAKPVKGLARFLEEYGITYEGHRSKHITWEWPTILKDAFDRNYPEHYVAAETLKAPHGIYALYFITRHIHGLEKFMEVVDSVDEQRQSQLPLFNSIEGNDETRQFLSKERSNNEVYEWMLKQGRASKSAFNILKDMEKRGEINVRSADAARQRQKGGFYLNYKSYQESPKIMIQSAHVGN